MSAQQGDSVIYMYIPFHILFRFGLSWDTEYSSLCYTAGPCCFSILYVYINLHLLIPDSLLVAASPLSVSERLPLLCGSVRLCQVLDPTCKR